MSAARDFAPTRIWSSGCFRNWALVVRKLVGWHPNWWREIVRPPLEYGDNFPVPTGGWNPAEPWRFPKHEILVQRPSLLSSILPWITLGVGVTLGILWMSWKLDLSSTNSKAPMPGKEMGQEESIRPLPLPSKISPGAAPASKPIRIKGRSHLA